MQQELKDLSPKTIQRAVGKQALSKPLTSYGLMTSLLGLAYVGIFGLNALIVTGAVVLGLVAIGNWVYRAIIKGDTEATQLVQKYRAHLENKRKDAIKILRKELLELDEQDGLKQVDLFEQKYSSFVDVLNKKLDPSELAYNRYLSIAEQVYLGGLDNLTNAALSLQSISAIDIDHIQRSLQRLSHSEEDEVKGRALHERLNIWKLANERASSLKLQNELALTNLDKVSNKIATTQIGGGKASVALEDSMEELKRLIDRADRLSD